MSELCSCGHPSKGSIGMLRLCYDCVARLLQQPKRSLRERFGFRLSHGRMELGVREWEPDAARSRERKAPTKARMATKHVEIKPVQEKS